MSKSTRTLPAPTAADVRAFAAAHPEKFSDLDEKARHTAQVGQKGRLHKDVIALFNKGRKPHRRYVVGAARKAQVEASAATAAKRQALRDAGVPVKDRGRLPKVDLSVDKA